MTRKLPFEKNQTADYILWGAGQIGKEIVRVMKEVFPGIKLQSVIDSYSCGKNFLGIPIEPPDAIIKKYMNTFLIIATYSGERFVRDYLAEIGKSDFISFASVNG